MSLITVYSLLIDYPIVTSSFVVSSSIVIYINKNQSINKIAMNYAWNSMRVVSQIQIWYNIMLSNCCGWCDYRMPDTGKNLLIIREGKPIESTKIITSHIDFKYPQNYDLIIYKYPSLSSIQNNESDNNSTILYKRYIDLPEILDDSNAIKSLFIVANIRYGGKVYTIDDIDSLTIPNTQIFDRPYTQWYMFTFHNLEIFDDDYTIEILDSNLSEVIFDHTKHIKLGNKNFSIYNSKKNDMVWRTILDQNDIEHENSNIPNISLDVINSPPLHNMISTTVVTPLSLNSDDTSFDIIDKLEAGCETKES
jgi:hypothetical protein